MNLIFSFPNSVLIAIVFVSVLGPHQVNAAVCTEKTGFTCVVSDHTKSNCNRTSGVCDCETYYEPINTGCAPPPLKPTVTFGTRINQRVSAADPITLTCSHYEPGTVTFEWKKDGKVVSGQTDQTYVVTGGDADIAGKYSCAVKDQTSGLTSADSDPQEIVAPLEVTKVTPKVTLNTDKAALGVPLDVQCTGIPFGATYKFKLDSSQALVDMDKVIQDSNSKKITCVLDNVKDVDGKNLESTPPSPLPTDATDIDTAIITPSSEITIKAGSSVTFTCDTTPAAKYMETGKISYTFTDTGNQSPEVVDNKYTLKSTAADKTDRTVTCSATYDKKTKQTSDSVVVKFRDNAPTLNANSTSVSPGSLLFLTCKVPVQGDTISWAKDGKPITRENENIIQIGSFKPEDAGKYVCTATNGFYTADSNEIVIKTSSGGPPTLSASSTSVSPGSSLNLTCNATDKGDKISWARNKTITGKTDRVLQIPNFQATDAGIYVCTATNDYYNLISNEVDIKLSHAPGLPALGSAVTVLIAVLSWRLL